MKRRFRPARAPGGPAVGRMAIFCVLLVAVAGCVDDRGGPGQAGTDRDPAADPQQAFLMALSEHCGRAFSGRITLRPPEDELFRGNEELTVHFRECSPSRLAIPFHVEDDRSRTWLLTRTDSGIDLRHDHRHADGSPAEVTMYGAHTSGPGTSVRQEFLRPPDGDEPRSGWAIEILPGERYTYGTILAGEWRYRLDFDLTAAVDPPPAPWGH